MVLTDNKLERYTRQIVFSDVGIEGQKKLLNSKVLVVGAGGLGSACLMLLAASGIGKIGIVDYDSVELSNLHRQIIHNSSDINKPKTVSAKEKINHLNPDVSVETFNEKINEKNIETTFSDYEIIVDGLDNFNDKFLLNDYSVKLNKQFIHAGVIGFEGQVLTVIPHTSSCLRCYFSEVPSDSIQNCKELGVLGTCVAIISSIQANEVLKLILGIGKPLTNRILKFNALTSSFYEFTNEVKQNGNGCTCVNCNLEV